MMWIYGGIESGDSIGRFESFTQRWPPFSHMSVSFIKVIYEGMKTLRQEKIEPISIDEIPNKEKMEQGKIYVSEKYHTSNHLCLCGCGEETVLPLNEDMWTFKNENGMVTMTPSILQRSECQSHYIITNGIANFV
jgi:hypothetical protein